MHDEERVNYTALWRWARFSPRRTTLLLRISWRHRSAQRRHAVQQRRTGNHLPSILALSPTMQCNYHCQGCYSRGRSEENELSTHELDRLLSEAEDLGIHSVVVTGGEPLLRSDMPDLMCRHQRLLFFLITNGSLLTSDLACRIVKGRNVIPLVSIEGFAGDTDERRRHGAYDTAIRAFAHLREARALFGFCATCTAANFRQLSTDAFINEMVTIGCAVGFFIEYVPCGLNPRLDWVLDEPARNAFRKRVLEFRRGKPIVVSQFPGDEYVKDNLCSAAGRTSLHINSQGDVEPCPFVSLSRDNVRGSGLLAACQSPFLRAIRQQPKLLQRHHYGCSLFEHRTELDKLAQQFDLDGKDHPSPA
jgi:MoaA/NifB/PqqE/SkfB family radical SAM enzyme